MRANEISHRLKHIALVILLLAISGTATSAQTAERSAASLETALVPGATVWITGAGRPEERVRIVGVSGGIVTADADGEVRRWRATEILRVQARRSDSLVDGALIGAGASVAAGLFLCTRTEPWENCRDDVGPMVRIGAIGAGVGVAVDALVRGRRTVYEAPGSARLRAMPFVAHRGGGLRISVGF